MANGSHKALAVIVSFHVIIRRAAEDDMTNAASWYELQSPGLGGEYLRSVESCIESITRHPQIYPVVYRGIQRALLRRFPFGIFFINKQNSLIVLGCLHTKRHPDIFKARQ